MIALQRILAPWVIGFMVCSSATRAEDNSWSTTGPEGARVSAICLNPLNNQEVYMGTIEKGVYKSTDSGTSWVSSNGQANIAGVRVIAIHPFGPDTIYATTAQGMYKSTDAGTSWAKLYPPWGSNNEYRAFAIHPRTPNVIFAVSSLGDYLKSTDSGESWYRMSMPDPFIGGSALAIDTTDPGIMYLAGGPAYVGKGFYKSTDGGETWFNSYGNLDSSGFGVDVVIDPFDPNILYYSRNDIYVQSGHCLAKSTDQGRSWSNITPPNLRINYIHDIKVSPFDHNTVYVTTDADGVMMSTDGGATWQARNDGLQVRHLNPLVIDPVSGIIYLGTYFDGLYKFPDGGGQWQKSSGGLFLQTCEGLAFGAAADSLLFVATMSGVYSRSLTRPEWNHRKTGMPYANRAAALAVDPNDPQTIYLGTARRYWEIGNAGFYISTDGGETWARRSEGLAGLAGIYRILVSYSPIEARRILLASSMGIYYSDDLGQSWNLCSNGVPYDAYFKSLATSPVDNNIIAAGNDLNRVYISLDRGESWRPAAEIPLPGGSSINAITFHPDEPQHLYAASYNVGIFESTDLGANWVNINNNLPIVHSYYDYIIVSDILINPFNPDNIFVLDAFCGVYQTRDGGQFWEPFNTGLDTTLPGGILAFAPGDTSRLYVASYGRSVWSIHRTATGVEDEPAPLPQSISLSVYPNPFNSRTTLTVKGTMQAPISIYDVTGRKVGSLQAHEGQAVWEAAGFSSGLYFARVESAGTSPILKLILLK